MDPNTDGGARRRIVLRRSRGGGFGGGGFSASTSTRAEGMRETDDHPERDEVDDAVDLNTISNRIQSGGVPAPVAPPPGRDTPASRMNDVAMAGSARYAKEYRLTLLHRLLMRNVPLDQIARQLGVSISTVEKDRIALKARLRDAAMQLNVNELIGQQNAVYDEISGMAMRVASQAGTSQDENGQQVQAIPVAMRLAAMRTALAAQADRTRFLSSAGVFDVLRFRRAEDGGDETDIQMLMRMTGEALSQLAGGEGEGFGPLTFDNPAGSSADDEIQEL